MDKIEIYTSKKKSFLLLICSIVFVVIGIWLVIEADNLTGWKARNPLLTRGIGMASIIFFGLGTFVGIKRLLKSELALIIDENGLNLSPKKSLSEFIKWNDIVSFEEIKIHSTRILIVHVKNSQYWLAKETNSIKKKLMQFNINTYDSPFNIASSGLDISSAELNEKLNHFLNKFKNNVH